MYITINGKTVKDCIEKLNTYVPKHAKIKKLVAHHNGKGVAKIQCELFK